MDLNKRGFITEFDEEHPLVAGAGKVARAGLDSAAAAATGGGGGAGGGVVGAALTATGGAVRDTMLHTAVKGGALRDSLLHHGSDTLLHAAGAGGAVQDTLLKEAGTGGSLHDTLLKTTGTGGALHDTLLHGSDSMLHAAGTGGALHDTALTAHEQLHRHHMHLRTGDRHSGTGLIWVLVFLHLAFIGYWIWVYFRQRSRVVQAKGREPERVNCVYEFALPTLQLGGGMTASSHKIP